MKHVIDAVYENGLFRPIQRNTLSLAEGKLVRLLIEDETEPEALKLVTCVFEGLSDTEIDEIEQIALDRHNFFDMRTIDDGA